ncbi:hypothetical protein Pmani_024277 [Petrolisthes manimaculis]|uniref:Uncharacterized protein n=1 Tax=Petrolisthes manimaculis TaxID=1843537 RepID=A0AAE1P860_9EUCA|nr:hypothetical protein Pmani_024277 [Petrolisthes manimaculis]
MLTVWSLVFWCHGKRADPYPLNQLQQVQQQPPQQQLDQPRYPMEDENGDTSVGGAAIGEALYPPRVPVIQDTQLPYDEALSNPEIMANVRNWVSVLGRRLRRVSSRMPPAPAPAPVHTFLQ